MNKVHAGVAAIATALVPAIAGAEPSEPVSFRYAGETYIYTVEQVGDKRVLRGTVGVRREPFVLNVGKRWVNGTSNGSEVSFSLKSVKPVSGIVTVDQLAER